MVEYADFHVLIATLAPVFFVAGLVGLYKAGNWFSRSLNQASQPVTQGQRWTEELFFILVAIALLVAEEVMSLRVLGGWAPSSEQVREFQIVLLGFQAFFGLLGVVLEALGGSRRQ